MTTETVEKDTARSQAKAQLESITEMLERLEHCRECDGSDCMKADPDIQTGQVTNDDSIAYHNEEDAQQAIYEDPLEVSVRGGWRSAGLVDETAPPEEYKILLCTGGPACRITGTIDQHGEPDTATIEYQDWFLPWTAYVVDPEEGKPLLEYARQFIFAQ